MHYSIVRLVGTGRPDDPFRAPTMEEYSLIDFRPLNAQEAGKTDGWAIVATEVRDTALGIYLGDNSSEISPVVSRILSSRFDVTLDADPTLGELIGELLIVHATPPKDASSWNPAQPVKVTTPRGTLNQFEIYLGNEVVWSAETLSVEGGQQFTDDFNRSNSSTPGSNWQVRQGTMPIVSQKIQSPGSDTNLMVWTSDLNSVDHWAQIDQVTSDANFRGIDTQVRMNSTSTDLSGYGTGFIVKAGSYEIYKKSSNGNQTNLFTISRDNPQSAQIRTDIRGSTLKGSVGGVVQGQVTDTTYQTGRRTGVFAYQPANVVFLDNFVAADFQATFSGDGTIGLSGTELSRTNKSLAGSVSSSGAYASMRAVFRQFVGAINPVGVLKRAFARRFVGTIAPQHVALRRSVTKFHAGTVTAMARIKFMPIRRFRGTVAVVGTLTTSYVGRIAGAAGYAVGVLRKAAKARGFLRPGRRQ